jgi:uncharacterized membrane protein YkvA (DUF1232 family)
MENTNHKTDFTENELKISLDSHTAEAESLLSDPEKMDSLLEKARKLLDKTKKIPVIGALVHEIITMIEMIRDYIKGEYKSIPLRVMASIVAAILYLVSPIDLIPDVIPILGFIDDASVISLVISLGAGAEISKYRKWREKQEADELDNIIANFEADNGD